jgi:GxxExxY protein
MPEEKYKYSDITGKIIGAAMEVHKILGCGFQEAIYQEALKSEFSLKGLSFLREFEMPIFYKEAIVGTRRVDFLVESIISVEIKAITKLEEVHYAQAINYLEAYNLEIGLLLNFGSKSFEVKRFINSKFRKH